ncbi:MAG: glycosyltransferase family 2 protein [Candidatus Omnitrophica bacterium]|nr:glycosyltransferase family 2 protein [Candidatus Omnitrophota bacterium]
MPGLSVIVPSYNSEKSIGRTLAAIRGSSYGQYELIVVDDGSSDQTALIAEKYADKLIRLPCNSGKNNARRKGLGAASAEIIVNIDSDVVVRPDTLANISNYFSEHPETGAITGLFSKHHPNDDFFSQYKNLYMHYIFKRLPEKVTFLFGSIYAIRKESAVICNNHYKFGEDTAYGQQLVSCGRQIAFLNDLEVTHLKKYNFFSLLKNDFRIAFYWANILIKYKGWEQLGKNKIGFAHSPVEQLISVVLAFLISLCVFVPLLRNLKFLAASFCLVILWLVLNLRFFWFLFREKGLLFILGSIFLTFLDNIVMASGIILGLVFGLTSFFRDDKE